MPDLVAYLKRACFELEDSICSVTERTTMPTAHDLWGLTGLFPWSYLTHLTTTLNSLGTIDQNIRSEPLNSKTLNWIELTSRLRASSQLTWVNIQTPHYHFESRGWQATRVSEVNNCAGKHWSGTIELKDTRVHLWTGNQNFELVVASFPTFWLTSASTSLHCHSTVWTWGMICQQRMTPFTVRDIFWRILSTLSRTLLIRCTTLWVLLGGPTWRCVPHPLGCQSLSLCADVETDFTSLKGATLVLSNSMLLSVGPGIWLLLESPSSSHVSFAKKKKHLQCMLPLSLSMSWCFELVRKPDSFFDGLRSLFSCPELWGFRFCLSPVSPSHRDSLNKTESKTRIHLCLSSFLEGQTTSDDTKLVCAVGKSRRFDVWHCRNCGSEFHGNFARRMWRHESVVLRGANLPLRTNSGLWACLHPTDNCSGARHGGRGVGHSALFLSVVTALPAVLQEFFFFGLRGSHVSLCCSPGVSCFVLRRLLDLVPTIISLVFSYLFSFLFFSVFVLSLVVVHRQTLDIYSCSFSSKVGQSLLTATARSFPTRASCAQAVPSSTLRLNQCC